MCQDGEELPIANIIGQFNGSRRPHLADKLKLLLIDASRGQKYDHGVVTWHDDKVVTARGTRVLDMVCVSEHNNCVVTTSGDV